MKLLQIKQLGLTVFVFAFALGHSSDDCESCPVTRKLIKTQQELLECQEHLHKLVGSEASYLSQIKYWISKPNHVPTVERVAFRSLLDKLLKSVDLDGDPKLLPETVNVDLSMKLSKDDVISLRRHLLADEGTQHELLKILNEGILKSSVRDAGFDWPQLFHFDHLILAQTLSVSLTVLGCLLCGVAVWKVALIIFVGSWSWTWCHLYQQAVAKKQATLLRLGDVPQTCMVKQGWLASISEYITGAQSTKCEAYYEALIVNPILEVTPLKALTEMLAQFIFKPLNILGEHLGGFYKNLLEPLPWAWKLPVILVVTILMIIVCLLGFRYKFRFGFNLFSIEPSSAPKPRAPEVPHDIPNELPYNKSPNIIDNLISDRPSWWPICVLKSVSLKELGCHRILLVLYSIPGFFVLNFFIAISVLLWKCSVSKKSLPKRIRAKASVEPSHILLKCFCWVFHVGQIQNFAERDSCRYTIVRSTADASIYCKTYVMLPFYVQIKPKCIILIITGCT